MAKVVFLNLLLLTVFWEQQVSGGSMAIATAISTAEMSSDNLDGDMSTRVIGAVGQVLANVRQVRWAPHGLSYWVVFKDSTAQMYLSVANAVGQVLTNVRQVEWGVLGKYYWVIFNDGTAQMYSMWQGAIGQVLTNVRTIRWSPAGKDVYWVLSTDQTARFYTEGTGLFGEVLTNVKYIFWSRNGSQYLVLFTNNNAQMYNLYDLPAV